MSLVLQRDFGLKARCIGLLQGVEPAAVSAARVFQADHQVCWQKCGIPNDVAFHTRPEPGQARLQAIVAEGGAFPWVTMDEGYGAPATFGR